MGRSRLARVTSAYALCHFVVDLACITCVLGLVTSALSLAGAAAHGLAIVAYDMVAFCLQLPVGAALDVAGPARWRGAALLSFALVAAGVVVAGTVPVVAVPLVALGNALFHCAGGEEVLLESNGSAGPSGAFISTGAAGVFVGGLATFQGWTLVVPVLVGLLGLCAVLVWRLGRSKGEPTFGWSLDARGRCAVALLAATVALRSYAGMVMAFPWKVQAGLALVAILAVVAGKAAGGFASDRVGPRVASVISLGGAAPLFLLSWESVAAGLVATLLFNFTMAITLSQLAGLMPQARGTAFGIASFSLAIGALPALLGVRAASPGVLCALSLASLALLLGGLWAAGERGGS